MKKHKPLWLEYLSSLRKIEIENFFLRETQIKTESCPHSRAYKLLCGYKYFCPDCNIELYTKQET